MDIETNGPRNFLSIPNTNGYQLKLEYERVTKYGMIYSFGFGYGRQAQDMNWNLNSKGFFPDPGFGNESQAIVRTFHDETPYYTINLSVGYQYKPLKSSKMRWLAKAGLSTLQYIKGEARYYSYYLLYHDLATPTVSRTALFATTYTAYGHANESSWKKLQGFIVAFQVTAAYPVDFLFMDEIRLGLHFTYAIHTDTRARGIYYDLNGKIGYQDYSDKFRTIGITTALVF